MRKNYYPSIEETCKIYKFKQLNSVKNIENMQKITIKVDGIKKRDKIIAQQERGGDRTLPGVLFRQSETSRSTILLYRILSARRKAVRGRSSTTGVSPKKQAENAKLWR